MNLTELNQSYRCLYFSCPERSKSFAFYFLLYVSAAAVVLFTVCGNMLVIVSVFHFRQLHTPTNMLILSLAVSDFLVGAFVMPTIFIWAINACWLFGTGYCMFTLLFSTFLLSLSVYHIVLIAVDRYVALSNPFLYTNIMSLKKIRVIILSQWCLWISYNSGFIYFNGNFKSFKICPGECFILVNDIALIIDLVTTFLFPCTLIIILYTGVFVIAKKHATAIREIKILTQPQTHTNSMRSERKAAKVLGILVSVFLACLLPYFIYSLLANFIELKLEVIQLLVIVFCINSAINPVIYALFYSWFRMCVKIIITLNIFHNESSLINVLS